MAVLARTNAQLVLFERELAAAGVPYRSGGGRSFLARPSVRGALDQLTRNSEQSGFHAWLEDLLAQGPVPAGGNEADETDWPGEVTVNRLAVDLDLAELANLGLEYVGYDTSPSPDGFVSWLEASLRSDPPRQAGDAVDLVTFHRGEGPRMAGRVRNRARGGPRSDRPRPHP